MTLRSSFESRSQGFGAPFYKGIQSKECGGHIEVFLGVVAMQCFLFRLLRFASAIA